MRKPEICEDEQRRKDVRRHHLNGIDFVEVSDDMRSLRIYFLGKAPRHIKPSNVRIEGGVRVRDLRVTEIDICASRYPDLDDCMVLTLDRRGDFSNYTLHLVEEDEHHRPGKLPLKGFDPRYAELKFNFLVGCPTDLDCAEEKACPPQLPEEPHIDYLAKDYASFRKLILDRLALIMPEWKERHVPDLDITLVELLAYTGDYLSYYQDAVATEAYISTARQRISVRRHARLVDYPMHEGCNARTWLCVETSADITLPQGKFYFITGHNSTLALTSNVLNASDLRGISSRAYEVFEPMNLEADPASPEGIQLYQAHSAIPFYTWGNRECCIPKGATAATLLDGFVSTPDVPAGPPWQVPQGISVAQTTEAAQHPEQQEQEQAGQKQGPAPGAVPEGSSQQAGERQRLLHLRKGDILILEEVIGPRTGSRADADPGHRQAVRLTRVEQDIDQLYNQLIVNVEWSDEDALLFPLCLSSVGEGPECEYQEGISVARGNVILVDHGKTVYDEDLGHVPVVEISEPCADNGCPPESTITTGNFRPRLANAPLTFSQPLPPHAASSGLLVQYPRQALPQAWLTDDRIRAVGDPSERQRWNAQPDLLGSASRDCHFIGEMDNEGRAYLRFGDGELGCSPPGGARFSATYRVGNGTAGNVGAEAISHLVFREPMNLGAYLRIRNPLPAQGGSDPEPIAEVKLFAPTAFRKELQRAVTAEDYASLAQRNPTRPTEANPKVQCAAATLRWTGSWYEVRVAIDPAGGETASKELLRQIDGYLHRYRRAGHDVVVVPATYVSLDITMKVCVLPHYLHGHVKGALLDVFSNRVLPNGQRGLFHPDKLTFGTSIYLSTLVAAAQAVEGVESVQVVRLQRLYEQPNHEIENDVLPIGPLEIARLDNDPSLPEHGVLRLDVRGGR